MTELTEGWPGQLSRDLRQVCLISLMHEPLRWRSRRIDYFESDDLHLQLARTGLDIRVRRQFVESCMHELIQGYKLAGKSGEDWTEVDHRLSHLDSVDSADLLVPLFWLPGPTMDMNLDCDGAQVIPLTRREAADVISEGVFLRIMQEAHKAGLASIPKVGGSQDTGLWRDLGWCLAATDAFYLQNHELLRGLAADSEKRLFKRMRRWFLANLTAVGCSDSNANELLDGCTARMELVVARVLSVRDMLRQAQGDDSALRWNPCSPATNPLLMLHSYLRRVDWTARRSAPAEPAPDIETILSGFLHMCIYWIHTVETTVLKAQPYVGAAQGGDEEARRTLALWLRLASSWPVLGRVRLPIDRTTRVTLSQRVPMPNERPGIDESDAHPRAAVARLLVAAKIGPYLVLNGARRALDFVLKMLIGSRPRFRADWGTVGYPLTFHDAMSYHVEVASSGKGASLVPRAAFVRIPRKDYGSRALRSFVSGRLVAALVGQRRLDVCALFGRVTDDSGQRQHFYTTKSSPSWVGESVWGRKCGVVRLPGQPVLHVRYRMSGPWAWAMVLASVSMLALALAVLRLSMLETLDLNTYPDAVSFSRMVTFVGPVFMSIMLLVAVDRRESPLLARRMGVVAWLVLAAFLVFGLAVAGWLLVKRPMTVWQGAYVYGDMGTLGTAWHWTSGQVQDIFNAAEAFLSAHWLIALVVLGAAVTWVYPVALVCWIAGILTDWISLAWRGAKRVYRSRCGLGREC